MKKCPSHSSCTNFIIFIGFPQEPAQTTSRIGKEYEEMDDSITMKAASIQYNCWCKLYTKRSVVSMIFLARDIEMVVDDITRCCGSSTSWT